MKRISFFISSLLCFFSVFGQQPRNGMNANSHQRAQYGIIFCAEDGTYLKQKATKHAVAHFILEACSDTSLYSSDNGKIFSFLPLEENEDSSNLPDTLCGIYEITNIMKKSNNFIVQNNKLRKTTMLIIDVANTDSMENQKIKYIRILVFRHLYSKGAPRLKTAHQYKFTLTPFFHNNCCDEIVNDNGAIVYPLRQSRSRHTYLINGVLVPYFNFNDYNIVEIVNVERIN